MAGVPRSKITKVINIEVLSDDSEIYMSVFGGVIKNFLEVTPMSKKYDGKLFNSNGQKKADQTCKLYDSLNLEVLIRDFSNSLLNKYGTACLDVKQLQEVLNVGESNVYTLLKDKIMPCKVIGKRKVVPVTAIAAFLLTDVHQDISS